MRKSIVLAMLAVAGLLSSQMVSADDYTCFMPGVCGQRVQIDTAN